MTKVKAIDPCCKTATQQHKINLFENGFRIILLTLFLSATLTSISQNTNQPADLHSAIIKLNWRYLDLIVIDDETIYNGSISRFLNEDGEKFLEGLENNLFLGLTFRKVFPFLSTTDTVSISRLGTPVRIPAFWSVVAVELDYATNVFTFCRLLERLSPLVLYAHPNYKVEFLSDPNDPEFVNQYSFKSSAFPNADIDLDSAWNLETGKPFIKVGVYDSGIDSSHPDIELLGGKGYYSPLSPSTQWGYDTYGHGTQVAGIIGANRNNDIGIAGIAGGDGSDSTGISLIDFNFTGFNEENVEVLCAGIIDGSRSVGSYFDWSNLPTWANGFVPPLFDGSQGFGIHVANHSYTWNVEQLKQEDSIVTDNPTYYMSDCILCIEAYLFSLENNVTHVVARGNVQEVGDDYGADVQWPQKYPDHMVISVGGHGYDGERWWYQDNFSTTDGTFGSMIGGEIDLTAPASDTLTFTTQTLDPLYSLPLYNGFYGTSAAAPHVTGSVALLLSYYNKPCYSNYNLANEDIEYLLQISTVDSDIAGYDINTGYGRLNVNNLFDSLERPSYQIVHPQASPISYIIYPPDTVGIVGRVFQSYGPYSDQDLTDPIIQNGIEYWVERYKVEATYDFSAYTGVVNVELLGAWPRINTSSFSAYMEDSINVGIPPVNIYYKKMNLERDVELVSYDQNTITLSGYLYRFFSDIGGFYTANAWYPVDTNNFNFDYSIYLRDTLTPGGLNFDFPCDSVNFLYDSTAFLKENKKPGFLIYPNPFENSFIIQSDNQPISEIYVYDLSGRCVFKKKELNVFSTIIESIEFANGLYLVEVRFTDNTKSTQKIIKR